MTRPVAVVLRLAIAIVVALVLLGVVQWVLTGAPLAGLAEGARILFLFMDIGLVVWLALLIVGAVRGWGRGRMFAAAVVGVLVNLVTVVIVGFVQSGTMPWQFVGYAVGGGAAFLVGAGVALAVVPPRVRR